MDNLKFGMALIAWLCLFGVVLLGAACKKDRDKTTETTELGTCKEVAPRMGLKVTDTETFVYESAGGAVIRIMRRSRESLIIQLRYKAYPNFTYEFWGDADPGELGPASHENLNGKHVKDRFGTNRSVIFPDGTKMTYVSTAPWYMGGITAITIYDGEIVQHLNMECYKLEYSGAAGAFAMELDARQPDGETSAIELSDSGLSFYNLYTEDTPGNKVEKREDIGSLAKDNPNQVNDYFEDPRLSYT